MADSQSSTITLAFVIDQAAKRPLRCRLGLHINGWLRQEFADLQHGFEYKGCVRCGEPIDEETARDIAHFKAGLEDLGRALRDE